MKRSTRKLTLSELLDAGNKARMRETCMTDIKNSSFWSVAKQIYTSTMKREHIALQILFMLQVLLACSQLEIMKTNTY